MSFLRPIELSEPKVIRGETSPTAGEPISVAIEGIVFEVAIYNLSEDYNLYVSFDFGDTYVTVEPDSFLRVLFGAFPDPLLLLKSDGASQPFEIVYRLVG